MAINKRKILQSAQKHMQKGALDKALKDYMALLKGDPKDANVRLKVGDIHLKQGKTDDAVAAYRKVADQFMTDGFDAKAVAIFKQVTKIDAKRFDIYLPLSELYQRMGLTSEAMRSLQTAADGAYREGDKDQALDLLRKMAALDPSNTTNRLKVAELLKQEGRDSEAIAEFQEVAAELERQGDEEDRLRVLERLVEVGGSDRDTVLGLGRACLDAGRFDLAIRQGQALIDADVSDADGYEILGAAYDGAQNIAERTATYTKLAEIYRERGDDDLARDIQQRFGGDAEFGVESSDDPVFESGDEHVDLGADSPELDDPGYASADGLAIGEPISDLADERALEEADAEDSDPAEDSSASGLPRFPELEGADPSAGATAEREVGEGDPEQLLAEASVYLRYGKRERALESLRSILSSHPDHRGALEKLAEALDGSDDDELASTQARLEALGGGHTAVIEEEPPVLEADIDDEFDIEFEDEDHDEQAALDADASPEPPLTTAAADRADEVEIDLDAAADDVLFEGDSDSVTVEDDAEDDAPDGGIDFELSVEEETDALPVEAADAELDFEFDDPTDGQAPAVTELDAVDEPAADPAPETEADDIAFDVDEDIEIDAPGDEVEASDEPGAVALSAGSDVDAVSGDADSEEADDEFVIDLDAEDGRDADAEPDGEPDAELEPEETGDLQFEFETSDVASDASEDEALEADAPVLDLDLAGGDELALGDEESSEELEEEEDEDATETGLPRSASLTTPAQVAEELEEADFYFEQGMYDEAREIYERIVAGAPNHPQALLRLGEIDAAEGNVPGAVSEPVEADEAVSLETPELEETPDLGDALDFDAEPDADAEALGDEPEPEEDTSPTDAAVATGESFDDPVLGPDPDTIEVSDAGEADEADEEGSHDPIRPTDVEADITAPELDAEPLEEESAEPDEIAASGLDEPEDGLGEEEASEAEAAEEEEEASEAEAAEEEEEASDAEPEADEADSDEVAEPIAAASDEAGDATEDENEDDEDAFDLAAELSDAFDHATSGPAAGASTEEEGFEQVFAAFKQGVQNELEESDHEAHYDLGIAYKEMGLLEDAIGEFQAALSEDRQISCLHMMALCAFDLGRTADAVANLEQALSVPGVPDEQAIGVRFDLGRAYAKQGDVERARTAFEAVRDLDAEFCDVEQHLAELESAPSGGTDDAQADGEEAFESFDDLIASAEDTEEPVAAEPEYESFDELMGEDDEGAEEPEPEAPAPAEAAEAPAEASIETPPKKKAGRKKKTSFV